jgi:shikimate kinase
VQSSIFLVGPMGSGKTTVGRFLAQRRGMLFVDADHELEARTGVDIPYIFEREGEDGFREREEQLIDELSQLPGIVLATGGGAIMRPGNRHYLASRGLVVYLYTEVEQQWRRTRKSTHRPLLQQDNPKKKLKELMAIRDPYYRDIADLIVHSKVQSAKALAAKIDAYINARAST